MVRDVVALEPPGVSARRSLFWVAGASLAVPYIVHTKVLRNQAVRAIVELFWRALGKWLYDSRTVGEPRAASPEPFRHPELRNVWDIRLLELLPRGTSDRVCCRLITVDLDTKPPAYEAMSYTWGDPARTHTIWIDGCPVKTTRNVYKLVHDRSPVFGLRRIWIDAVCIN